LQLEAMNNLIRPNSGLGRVEFIALSRLQIVGAATFLGAFRQ
jgi:hypothetical protein